MNIIDTLIYVRDRLSDSQRTEVEQTLCHQHGVMSSHFNQQKTHMLMLTYDPTTTNSGNILSKIASLGLDARLVGL